MGSLSRRQFLTRAAVLAAALGVDVDDLSRVLASAPTGIADIPSTLQQTILYGGVQKGSYRLHRERRAARGGHRDPHGAGLHESGRDRSDLRG
ncbi:twin-arginine translocation signal domain-containing protein [Microbacterium aurantiacum]|uniref:Twin-arginine translocation signal domain-containing protein n=1 Tax=Microbacterium aurantiacum TaxID=162393 RepID=A0AAJ2LWF5_9MICO|nr:twin-arginine translocation signal domain-containing protein [Microbacterium aurantiacum]MDN4464875.1 twin-arginine translocation signal domain-containing protein [Microbacterium aurantiacum]MDS0245667.1 twin-arginine translocation signal domain-containing protein [Microbacterium aurantiacum]